MWSCRQELCVRGQRWHRVRQADLSLEPPACLVQDSAKGRAVTGGGGGVDSFSKSQSSISPSALPSPCPLSLQLSFLLPPFLHFSYDFLFLPLAPSSPPFLHLSFPFFSFSQFSSIPTPPAFFTLEACGSIHYTSIMCNNFCFLDETHKMNKRHLCLPR